MVVYDTNIMWSITIIQLSFMYFADDEDDSAMLKRLTLLVFVSAGRGAMIMLYHILISLPFFCYLSFNVQTFIHQMAFIYVTLLN